MVARPSAVSRRMYFNTVTGPERGHSCPQHRRTQKWFENICRRVGHSGIAADRNVRAPRFVFVVCTGIPVVWYKHRRALVNNEWVICRSSSVPFPGGFGQLFWSMFVRDKEDGEISWEQTCQATTPG